jgi:hypothetical protein
MIQLKHVLFLVILTVTFSITALCWGNATHIYFAHHLGAKHGSQDIQEMYGAVLPDAFNFMFDANGQFLYLQTHDNFEQMNSLAWNAPLKSVAFGFTTHNQLFGADWTAHINSFTRDTGYAVSKGIELAPKLIPTLTTILTDAGVDPGTAEYVASQLAPALGHDLTETAVDILVKRNIDPVIGYRIAIAAKYRYKETPLLLSAAYADLLSDFAGISKEEAAATIIAVENSFNEYIFQYGTAFALPEKKTIALLAQQTAPLAEMYIEAAMENSVDVTVSPDQVAQFISEAINIVKPDYREELRKTLRHLEESMESYKHGNAIAVESTEALDNNSELYPTNFSLEQNYPNPFNPQTTIQFSIPAQSHVTLKIYNLLGEEITTLIDNELYSGIHNITWDATGLPSGLYIYRLVAGSFTATKQLTLLK